MTRSHPSLRFRRNHLLLFSCLLAAIFPACGDEQATPTPAPAPSPVAETIFHDNFSAESTDPWKIDNGDEPFGEMKRSTDPMAPGLVVMSPGRVSATAEWQAGIAPFDFWFDLDVIAQTTAAWRYNGVAVVLSSAPVREMTANDVAFSTGIYQAGVRSAVAQGPFYKPSGGTQTQTEIVAEMRKAPKFQTSHVEKRYEINMGGAGGEDFSIAWPKKVDSGVKLRCRIQRLANNQLRFEVYSSDGNWSKPWWVGESVIPANLAGVPIRCVSVITTEENPNAGPPPASSGTSTPANAEPKLRPDQVSARISSIEGWTGDVAPPAITGYASGPGGVVEGQPITVTGTNFSKSAVVLINGTACETKVTSPTELKATATGLNKEGINRLQVTNENGLFAGYDAGIYPGLYLANVEPCEDLPAGGSVVTVHGGGFDAGTKISFNDRVAEVVGTPLSNSIQVKVPPGEAGIAKVTALKSGQSFSGTPMFGYAPHPYLLFKGKEGLAAMKARFNDPGFAPYKKAIILAADGAIPDIEKPPSFFKGGLANAILATSFAYCMTGDTKYKDAALKICTLQFEGSDTAIPAKDLNFPGNMRQYLNKDEFDVMNGQSFAYLYDDMFDELTPELRANLERYLADHMHYYKSRVAAGDWWYGGDANPSNTIAVGSGGGGTTALALRYSHADSDGIIDLAAKNIKSCYRAIQDDGGCTEGNMYWNYGLGHELDFGLCLQNALGNDKGMLSDPKFPKMVDFVATQLAGDGNMFVFNDTQPWLSGLIPEAFATGRFDQPLMRWACDEIVRRAANETQFYGGSDVDLALLFRDSKPMLEKMPDLPTMAYLHVMNWGVMRSSPQAFTSGLVVGVKGVGGQQTHHAEEDAGSFVVQSRGESFLIHPGYFQGTASEHNVPLTGDFKVDGREGETFNARAVAPISDAWENGTMRSMTVDATAAYKAGNNTPMASLVRRVLVLNDDKEVVTLDQVEPYDPSGKITSFYQCGFATTKLPDGNGFRIEGAGSDLVVLIDGPKAVDLSIEGPMKWKQDWVFAKTGVKWYRVKAPYAFVKDQPRISVAFPLGKGQPAPRINVQRMGDEISVVVQGARAVTFKKEGKLWKAEKPF